MAFSTEKSLGIKIFGKMILSSLWQLALHNTPSLTKYIQPPPPCLRFTLMGFRKLTQISFPKSHENSKLELLKDGKGSRFLNNWGFEGHVEVPRIGLSRGLALGWHQEFQFQVLIKSPNIIHTEVLDPKGDNFSLTFLYGHPTLEYRQQIWDQLQGIGTIISHRWLCIGDFNQVIVEEDKLIFKPSSIPGNLPLIQTLSNLSLLLVEAKGLSYTWMNKRKGNDFVMEKLDRAFANIDWFESYPNCLVTNLPIIGSNHGPIILDTDPSTPFKRRPFRFEWMWTTHPDCPVSIKNAWLTNPTRGSHAYCLTKKLENIRDKLKAWNKTSFRLIIQQILTKKEELRCA
uniref:Endonuclease/exonuclease/phosphatase domain-containing protein n=1 Tax=Fagus sylvatica TaxID=28930 RepID=A0A2N9EFY2_FAGSY